MTKEQENRYRRWKNGRERHSEDEDDAYHFQDDESGIYYEPQTEDTVQQRKKPDDVYIVRQSWGYCSILFSIVQIVILVAMMIQCQVAPMTINPMVGPYPDALNYWGAKNAVLIIEDGETWRLLSPILLHAGVIHLFFNVSVQLETGAFFEREWGSFTWLTVYLISGLGSSILSTIAMPGSLSVGSSGAVMGLFGGKLAEVFCRACEKRTSPQSIIAHEVRMEQLTGVLCSVVIVAVMSFIPYVDWAAHLGGLIFGILIGIVLFSFEIRNVCWRMFWFLLGSFLTLLAFVKSIEYMYAYTELDENLRDVCEYYAKYFEDYECHCQLDQDGDNNGDGD